MNPSLGYVLAVATAFGAMFLMRLVILGGLRLFGIQLPFSFRYKDAADIQSRLRLQKFGKGWFVFLEGVLLWALPLTTLLTVLNVMFRYVDHGRPVWSARDSLVFAGFLMIGGVLQGLSAWKKLPSPQHLAPSGRL